MMKSLFALLALSAAVTSFGQMSARNNGGVPPLPSFIDLQKAFPRPADAMARKEAIITAEFQSKGLKWPARYVYIRSFKYDSQLEVWVKNDRKDQYKLFKTYKVCALAGTLGPKRMEGDYQVPEGFYYINEYNARSQYHLSLGLNYPNASDRILSDSLRPGGEIYIHGSCVTVGCIPLTDTFIEELYIITAHAKDQGQDFIPVHIFPIKYNVKRSSDYLKFLIKDDESMKSFNSKLEEAFYFFEKNKQLPIIMVNEKGEYLVNNAVSRRVILDEEIILPPLSKEPVQHKVREIAHVADVVNEWPQYPGGGESFLKYLESIGNYLSRYLPPNLPKAYIQVEFIIDADGTPVNFKVLKGLTEEFNEEVITRMEQTMAPWMPAVLNEKPVAKKMVQTVTIEKISGK